jgi:catechol 2,3-dioxygenase-like lactoylglutathione lyase family enzyme
LQIRAVRFVNAQPRQYINCWLQQHGTGSQRRRIYFHMDNHFLQGIDTVILRVSDIEKSKEWYTQKLGLKEIHQDQKLKLVVLDTFSPTSLTIWETEETIEPNPQATTYPIFRTSDANDAHRQLKERDVLVGNLITDHVVTYFTFYDVDNNVLEVCQVHH